MVLFCSSCCLTRRVARVSIYATCNIDARKLVYASGMFLFFYTSVLFLSGLGVNIMKKKKTVQRENLCDSRQVKPKAHAWHALPPFSSPSRELPRPCMGTRGAVRGSRVRNCRTPRAHLRACPAPSSFRQQKEGSTA